MGRGAYYNENDPGAANTLRELIANNLIAPGDVDDRSIKDVCADDTRGYDQTHWFAGAGLWSGALRAAGWEDVRPIGTGSCPCQGFSLAGKGLGFDDPRHLFPDWLRIIDAALLAGLPWASTLALEQVASAGEWQSLVQSSLEDRGFAFGYADLPAAGFAQGAHIRQRFYGVADRHNAERWADMAGRHFGDWPQAGRIESYGQPGAGLATGGVAHHQGDGRRQEHADAGGHAERNRTQGFAAGSYPSSPYGGVGHHHHHHSGLPLGSRTPDERGALRVEGPALGEAGSLLGCDWLLCRDARIRPVESGTFPLAATHPGRVGALRIYGNGLDFETAVNFIRAYMDAEAIVGMV